VIGVLGGEWENGEQLKRVETWKMFAVVVPVFLAAVVALVMFAAILGIKSWIVCGSLPIFSFVLLRLLMSEIRRGRFRWFLRNEERNIGN
jgi:cell division protein FtsW (lipid II flippase)